MKVPNRASVASEGAHLRFPSTPILLACSACLLAACGSLLTPPPEQRQYDLGEPDRPSGQAQGERPRWPLAPTLQVRAPSWLTSHAMQYRLDHRPPASRERYVESRWAAQPAELLQHYLARALLANGGPGPATPGCRIKVQLDEFIQVFDSTQHSHAWLVGQIHLLAPREDRIVASRAFSQASPAPSADAPGGVLAHRATVAALSHTLSGWLDEQFSDEALLALCTQAGKARTATDRGLRTP